MLLHASGASNSFLFVSCTPPFVSATFLSLTAAWKRKTCILGRSDDPWWAISVSVPSKQSLVLTGNTGTSLSRQRFRSSRASSLSKIELLLSQVVTRGKKSIKRYNSYGASLLYVLHSAKLSVLIIFYIIIFYSTKTRYYFLSMRGEKIIFFLSAYVDYLIVYSYLSFLWKILLPSSLLLFKKNILLV